MLLIPLLVASGTVHVGFSLQDWLGGHGQNAIVFGIFMVACAQQRMGVAKRGQVNRADH